MTTVLEKIESVGAESKLLRDLRWLFANSRTWQELCGVGTADHAREFIYRFGTSKTRRPKLVLRATADQRNHYNSSTHITGTAIAWFEIATPSEYREDDEGRAIHFTNAVGGIKQDIIDLARSGGGFRCLRTPYMTPNGEPMFSPLEVAADLGVYVQQEWTVHHGLNTR